MANFYLVCGISGGGKTILSHRLKQDNPSIKVMLDVDEYYANAIAIDIVDTIANLPSVQPTIPTGKWEYV